MDTDALYQAVQLAQATGVPEEAIMSAVNGGIAATILWAIWKAYQSLVPKLLDVNERVARVMEQSSQAIGNLARSQDRLSSEIRHLSETVNDLTDRMDAIDPRPAAQSRRRRRNGIILPSDPNAEAN